MSHSLSQAPDAIHPAVIARLDRGDRSDAAGLSRRVRAAHASACDGWIAPHFRGRMISGGRFSLSDDNELNKEDTL